MTFKLASRVSGMGKKSLKEMRIAWQEKIKSSLSSARGAHREGPELRTAGVGPSRLKVT